VVAGKNGLTKMPWISATPNTQCDLVVLGEITRYDGSHFTREASTNLSREIVAELDIGRLFD